ncbi:AzlC family ABC transporter permease [Paracoccus shanxieyensis]|uniref:Branched-chain amino acid ABC transporter permease n=1 Tax=Paracoccus shanxieyensis TaxID=2675752 RepID=A0A6L6ITC2_9RHOB|nr:AzlC family ABC transporter permease [Paracoccus shanxieyensis]MTH62868.1 branched-chain amino acid ABC transporter permease [Paracoccus shanxieyensis]MTH86048.1 branched-chain amino acid ABC transporter permease [Paracoccus shanxieyensis]
MPNDPGPASGGHQPTPVQSSVLASARASAQARVLARSPAACLRHGMIQSLPFLLVLMPFGMLFGVVASEAGLNLPQVLGFAILVLAGASQFTAVQLLSEHTPAIIVIASALAVNLRMAMYSASLVPWLGAASPRAKGLLAYVLIDQTYAQSIRFYETNPNLRLDQRLAYFFGAAISCCIPWAIACALGFTLGRAIPESWALDFALPITFLAMVAPMLRTPAHIAAALVSILCSLAFSGLPSGMGVLLAAPIAMAAGVWVEIWTEKRGAGRA